ncbi:hypothetical protein GCM10025882_35620 [Acinetobacter gyllenbergii]|jgi:hypothetical protein|uniref:Uncharacterized protein n=1 Tax=Acinetobacter gyllenbergii CIP 110306 = MTCC 11365 TaxID=1217657 RepID=A0A829HJ83_9GAMM|nr:hypothetical protein F957_00937 [Acinetobacter gyllenbergii CIP 110306 = MTCC 11365]EPH33893.1 hypothetical protein L293_3662 [Acinetobacter gyllenbergii CIP 110306 = MTCC 11365]GMA13136.1 hypothetical protein GCM10025882_35620 [Acinetobacter gyllenbergii]
MNVPKRSRFPDESIIQDYISMRNYWSKLTNNLPNDGLNV